MERTVAERVRGFRTEDGDGVSLVRVLGPQTTERFDPTLMLDSFDSTDPADWEAGFPLHPHRGIETISFIARGAMRHRDSLGHEDTVRDGEVQWMTAGSGILHEEMMPGVTRLLGIQLWLNLPARDKMVPPSYHAIRRESIPEVTLAGSRLRVLAGTYGDVHGFEGSYLPLDYYDIHLEPESETSLVLDPERTAFVFTLTGSVRVAGEPVSEKTAARLTRGDRLTIAAGDGGAEVLYVASQPLREPIAWGGPIVMNTNEELDRAYRELREGTFA